MTKFWRCCVSLLTTGGRDAPVGGVDRAVHQRLVEAAEGRGVAMQNAVVERLSRDLDARTAELKTAKRHLGLLRLALRMSRVARLVEKVWRRLFVRRLKP